MAMTKYKFVLSQEHESLQLKYIDYVVQRQWARRFGSGNIKALFEAVEREQAQQRGNI